MLLAVVVVVSRNEDQLEMVYRDWTMFTEIHGHVPPSQIPATLMMPVCMCHVITEVSLNLRESHGPPSPNMPA